MKLKLDLHTHCWEATNFAYPSVEIAAKILDRVKDRGLDGIAITEHVDLRYAQQMKKIIDENFPDCGLIIIPGREVNQTWHHVVELFLDENTVFRFLAHPDFRWPMPDNIQGIEIENGMHVGQINKALVQEMADKQDLLILRDSDAHYLKDIGYFFNEISLEELHARAVRSDSIPKR